jgi:dissimilatory sulfite reductase (desulfoviridin) alpha/beta subunit
MGKGIFQQQKNGLYAVNISSPGGILTVEQLSSLAKTAADLGVWRIKCGARQTLIALLEEDKIDTFIEAVKTINLMVSPFGSTIRSIKVCSGGEGLCPRMLGNALDLGITIESKYLGQPTPKDFKISTAGCSRGCTEPYCADFGVIAVGKDLFSIVIGGRGSTNRPIHGQVIAKDVASDKVSVILDFVLEKYRKLAQPHERLCNTIERIGIEHFKPASELYETNDNTGIDEDFASFLLSDN